MSVPLRVIKLGGSLLDWPALATNFERWLSLEAPAANVVVVGGGAIVEAVRAVDCAQRLGPETAHWMAIRAMSLTAAIVAQRIPAAKLIASVDPQALLRAAGLWILDVERPMRADARGADPLPCTWETTSDAIAARLARRMRAGELVLLKSALPESVECQSWSDSGYVDSQFSREARGLSVRCVNLRQADYPRLVAN